MNALPGLADPASSSAPGRAGLAGATRHEDVQSSDLSGATGQVELPSDNGSADRGGSEPAATPGWAAATTRRSGPSAVGPTPATEQRAGTGRDRAGASDRRTGSGSSAPSAVPQTLRYARSARSATPAFRGQNTGEAGADTTAAGGAGRQSRPTQDGTLHGGSGHHSTLATLGAAGLSAAGLGAAGLGAAGLGAVGLGAVGLGAVDQQATSAGRSLTAGSAETGAGGGQPRPPEADDPAALDRLAHQLFGRFRGQLAAEFLIGRERSQLLTDF
jgi:serine protease Do